MHDFLDSRGLRSTDCFGQRFAEPGTYAYHVLPIGGRLLADELPYSVMVQEAPPDRRGDGEQVLVTLRWNGRRFTPDHAELSISAGDLVMWHCPAGGAPPHAIVGGFGSSSLAVESVYTHAFGLPGRYEWTDALGSELSGVVEVTDPGCRFDAEIARWRKRLASGTVVSIADGRAEPAEVSVEVGQTVFFAVAGGGPVTVTDRLLVDATGCDDGRNGESSGGRRGAAMPNRKARRTRTKAVKASQ
jgi:plastocyanin